MNFDIKATLAAMLNAVHGVVAADFPKVRACVQRALNEEREFLSELAKARIDGEIDDEILARQPRRSMDSNRGQHWESSRVFAGLR